jgi:Tfp pilus assembly major pilin PilA
MITSIKGKYFTDYLIENQVTFAFILAKQIEFSKQKSKYY